MTPSISHCRYVPVARVDEYCALGWRPDGSGPLHAPHGMFSVFLEWGGDGEPVDPAPQQQREDNRERATG